MSRKAAAILMLVLSVPVSGQGAVTDAAPAAGGEQTPEQAEDRWAGLSQKQLVALLDDASYVTRCEAEWRLLTDNTLGSDELRQYMLASVSEEQRYRLLRIARHHVLRVIREERFSNPGAPDAVIGDRASIGFSYEPAMNIRSDSEQPGVAVMATMPGFPGYAYLQPGDIIIAVDDQAAGMIQHQFIATTWFTDRIAVHNPGDRIKISVMRGDKKLDFEMPCAESAALKEMYTSNGAAVATLSEFYLKQWLLARAKLIAELPEPKTLKPAE